MRHKILITALIVALLAVAGVGSYFGYRYYQVKPSSGTSQTQNQNQQGSGSSSTGGSTNQSSSGGQQTQTPTTYPVSVYFSRHPDSDDDPSKTFPLPRTSPTIAVGSYAIEQLLAGPTASETSQGYFTTARLRSGTSNCSGDNFKLAISNSTATLQFCKPFDHLGVVADGQAESELKATLLQFPTVKKVVILNYQGDCEFNLSGQNLCKQ